MSFVNLDEFAIMVAWLNSCLSIFRKEKQTTVCVKGGLIMTKASPLYRAKMLIVLLMASLFICLFSACDIEGFTPRPTEETVMTYAPTSTPTPTPSPTPTPGPTSTPTPSPTPTPRLLQVIKNDVTGGKKKKEVGFDRYDNYGNVVYRESNIAGIKEEINMLYGAANNLRKISSVKSISDRNKTTITEETVFDPTGLKVRYEYHYANPQVSTDIVLRPVFDDEGLLIGLKGTRIFKDGSHEEEVKDYRIDYEYDSEGRISREVEIRVDDKKETTVSDISYEYDELGPVSVKTEKMSDGSVQTTTYARNKLGYLNTETVEITGLAVRERTTVTTYEYDSDHLLSRMTVEESGSFEKTYEYEFEYVYEELETEDDEEAS